MGLHPIPTITVPPQGATDVILNAANVTAGDIAIAQPHGPLDSSWSGLVWDAWVSSPGKVTVRLTNVTGSAKTVNPQALDLRIVPQ